MIASANALVAPWPSHNDRGDAAGRSVVDQAVELPPALGREQAVQPVDLLQAAARAVATVRSRR